MHLRNRVAKLEVRHMPAKPWHIIRQYQGQTEPEAIDAYEAANGPIGEGSSILRVIVKKPFVDPMEMK